MESKEGLATKKDLEGVERILSEKIDRVEKTLGERIEENRRKIEENSRKIDRVALQVVKNSEAIDKMVTRDEFNEFRSEVLSGQDKMMTILISTSRRFQTCGRLLGSPSPGKRSSSE